MTRMSATRERQRPWAVRGSGRPIVALVAFGLLFAACAAGAARPSMAPASPIAAASASPGSATETTRPPWSDDLEAIDRAVRLNHPAPFTIHPEAEWTARLEDVSSQIGGASPNEQIALVASLIGLLDTHSSLATIPGGWHFYGLLPYRFSDGWFVVRAVDDGLVGSRLVSINGTPIDDVVQRLTPLVPHDNETGLTEGLQFELNSVEYLNGAGIVTDVGHPAFGLERPDGTSVTMDPTIIDEARYDLINPGWLTGEAPEAVARRGERIWTRVDEARRTFLIAVNDYGDMTAAGDAMTAAFDAGTVDRVIFDMRYLQGGNGDIKIIETIRDDPRVNRPGALIVLTGRENVSAATQVVSYFDTETEALLVGESTPARADNFLCDCHDTTLPHSGFVVSVPTYWGQTGDDRPEIAPDVPMTLSSSDFFAGRDPVLDAALDGTLSVSSH